MSDEKKLRTEEAYPPSHPDWINLRGALRDAGLLRSEAAIKLCAIHGGGPIDLTKDAECDVCAKFDTSQKNEMGDEVWKERPTKDMSCNHGYAHWGQCPTCNAGGKACTPTAVHPSEKK